MIKRDPTLIFLPGSHCWSEEDLWKVGHGVELLFSYHGCRYQNRKKKKKMQFSCSFWFLCGCTENHIQCRLGKLFLLPTHPCPPFCSSSEVKQNVMYCILYDFFFFFSLQRVTVSGSRCWEGNRLQLCYFLLFLYRGKRGQVQLLFFV